MDHITGLPHLSEIYYRHTLPKYSVEMTRACLGVLGNKNNYICPLVTLLMNINRYTNAMRTDQMIAQTN